MKYKILGQGLAFFFVFLILIGCAQTAFSQNLNLEARLSEQRRFLEITGRVTNQVLCTNGNIVLSLVISVQNVSDHPIVFCKACMSDTSLFVSSNSTELAKNNFVYDLSSFGYGSKYELNNPDPTKTPFITLPPTKSFDLNLQPRLLSFDLKSPPLSSGNFVLIETVGTWFDENKQEKDLQEKWRKGGLSFWTEDLITEPISFTLTNSFRRNCS